jgi:hypothetical protein
VSALGGTTVLVIVLSIVVGYLALEHRYAEVLLIVVAASVGGALSQILKLWFGRARPDIVPHLVSVASLSFSQRALDAVGRDLPHAWRAHGEIREAAAHPNVLHRGLPDAGTRHRAQSDLARRSLSDRRAGRLVRRPGVGAPLGSRARYGTGDR